MAHETQLAPLAGRCDGCGAEHDSFIKLSMGKDFFGRSYDRLSPSHDQSPKWYCEPCSMYKNLQRDCRDIRVELDKVAKEQASELTDGDRMQRARLRLQEVAVILSAPAARSSLIDAQEVNVLIEKMRGQALSPSTTA
jgi:hypothetical protein